MQLDFAGPLRRGIDKDVFKKLKEEISFGNFGNKGEIILMADMNAHIRNDHEFIQKDSHYPLVDDLPNTYIVDIGLKERHVITKGTNHQFTHVTSK